MRELPYCKKLGYARFALWLHLVLANRTVELLQVAGSKVERHLIPGGTMKMFVRLCALSAVAACGTALHAAIITVNSTNNTDFSAGVTNLFYALSLANTNGDSSNTIKFNIPGSGAHYLKTPTNGYPLITNHNLTIDGYSQPGSAPNSNPIL